MPGRVRGGWGVQLIGGRVGGVVELTAGRFRNEGGIALGADRLRVTQGVFIGDRFEADGGIRLAGGHIGSQLNLSGDKFRTQGATAISADGLRVDHDAFCGEGFLFPAYCAAGTEPPSPELDLLATGCSAVEAWSADVLRCCSS